MLPPKQMKGLGAKGPFLQFDQSWVQKGLLTLNRFYSFLAGSLVIRTT